MKLFKQAQKYGRKIAAKSAVVVAPLALLAGQAHAALPTEATDAFTQMSSNWTDISPLAWGLLATTTAGFALMRLFKKSARQAV